jgi:hypothetical protein
MFNLAIDSKLRGCDLVSLKVEDVAPHGFALERASVRQRKTGHPVKFELTEQTREGNRCLHDPVRKETRRFPIRQPAQWFALHLDSSVMRAY